METNNSQDFEDYFNECLIINESKYVDDDDSLSSKQTEDADYEVEWLRNIGFDSLISSIEAGKAVPEDEGLREFINSLSNHQVAAVQKRLASLKMTVCKRRAPRQRLRDVRDVFPQPSESSSIGTRSRSATPDSLDSLSPSHTPPSPQEWIRATMNGSPTPSQGYHSHARSSPDPLDSPDSHKTERRSPSDWSSSMMPKREPSFVQIFRTPQQSEQSQDRFTNNPNHHHYKGSHSGGVMDIQILRSHKQGYDFSSTGTLDYNSGIEILDYQTKGSLSPSKCHFMTTPSVLSEADISLDIQEDDHRQDVDWGFERKSVIVESEEDLPDFVQVAEKIGITRITDLGDDDVKKVQMLSLIELTALFDSYGIQYSPRKSPKKKKKEAENPVFGVRLPLLLAMDQKIYPDCKVPLLFQKILSYLEQYALDEEGILRVPGVVAKIQWLRQEIESNFYSAPGNVDRALRACSVNDVAALVKQFLRELPIPLLTNEYMEAFFQVDRITEITDQVKALKLLIFLLPDVHRDTLQAFLVFLNQIVAREAHNRMSLQNVAMIIAPNLFLPKKQRKNSNRDLSVEINLATATCKITKMMIKYHSILWTVPNFLLQQIRDQNENALFRRRTSRDNNRPVIKLLAKSRKTDIYRKINNEVDFQEGIVRIQAPQFSLFQVPVKLNKMTTASDVVSRIIQESSNVSEEEEYDSRVKGRRDFWKRRTFSTGNILCISSFSTQLAVLENHALYEVGGNLGERRLDPAANMMSVYQMNPNTEWEVRCLHPVHQSFVKEVVLN